MATHPYFAPSTEPEAYVPPFIPRDTPYAQRLSHDQVEPPAPKLKVVAPPVGASRSAAARLAAKNPQQPPAEPDPSNPSTSDIMAALRALAPALDNIQRRLDHVERSVGSFEPPPSTPVVTPPAPVMPESPRDTEVTRGR